MKKLLIGFVFISILSGAALSQECPAEAYTVPPVIPEATKKIYLEKLGEAVKKYHEDPNDPDGVIWFGRRLAYLGNYKEALKTYNGAIVKFPNDARIYRHRAHRYITLRCFDDAIKDLKKAAKLTKGKPDEIEPDGLPNAKNIPTSTLQSNIWYHLGLAYYLKGDFKNALKAYRECMKVSKNPDMQVATAHWLYMTLRRMGKEKEARDFIATIPGDMEIIENDDYYRLVRNYKSKPDTEKLLEKIEASPDDLGSVSFSYGIANWFLYNDNKDAAVKIFQRIVNGNQWASFGFIAAEADLKRLSR